MTKTDKTKLSGHIEVKKDFTILYRKGKGIFRSKSAPTNFLLPMSKMVNQANENCCRNILAFSALLGLDI